MAGDSVLVANEVVEHLRALQQKNGELATDFGYEFLDENGNRLGFSKHNGSGTRVMRFRCTFILGASGKERRVNVSVAVDETFLVNTRMNSAAIALHIAESMADKLGEYLLGVSKVQ